MEIILLYIFLAGLAAGFINIIAGGGSMLTLPLLIDSGLTPTVANGTNRVAILGQNLFAIKGFGSKGYKITSYHIALGIAATLGSTIGIYSAVKIDGELFKKILGIVIILFIAYSLLKPKYKNQLDINELSKKQKWISYISFFFIGIYGGLIQAGVGIIIMGALSLASQLSIHRINSIKVVVVAMYTTIALGAFIYFDLVEWKQGLCLAAGNSIGGFIGGRYSNVIPENIIKYTVLVISFTLAIKLWFF